MGPQGYYEGRHVRFLKNQQDNRGVIVTYADPDLVHRTFGYESWTANVFLVVCIMTVYGPGAADYIIDPRPANCVFCLGGGEPP